jgi:hypothetical protein
MGAQWKEGNPMGEEEVAQRRQPVITTGRTPSPQIEFEKPGATLRRPLAIIGDTCYAATWLKVKGQADPRLFVAADGPPGRVLYGPNGYAGVEPLDKLPVGLDLPFEPEAESCWSGNGLNLWLQGYRASPAQIFQRIASVIDRFIDFSSSLAEQSAMCAVVALFVMATYFTDAFTVVAYLWASGGSGVGKSQLLSLIACLAYLGRYVLPSTTCPTLRDEAHYGATLCFDDAEALADARVDPDKRVFLLAGNRKGSTVGLKEGVGKRAWRTRWVSTYCSRAFSAIRLPDSVLASRSIMVPLVRTADPTRADADPNDDDLWPHPRQSLVDDLWNLALSRQMEVKAFYQRATAQLKGRDFEPWRGLLAVAMLVEADGQAGVVSGLRTMMATYQKERGELSSPDETSLAVAALVNMASRGDKVTMSDNGDVIFRAQSVAETANELAADRGLTANMTDKRVGAVLNRLRIRHLPRTGTEGRRRAINIDELNRLGIAYGAMNAGQKSSPTSRLVTSSPTEETESDYQEVWINGREPF